MFQHDVNQHVRFNQVDEARALEKALKRISDFERTTLQHTDKAKMLVAEAEAGRVAAEEARRGREEWEGKHRDLGEEWAARHGDLEQRLTAKIGTFEHTCKCMDGCTSN